MHFFCYKLYFYGVACEQLIWYGRHIKLPKKCPPKQHEGAIPPERYPQTQQQHQKIHSLYNFMYLWANVIAIVFFVVVVVLSEFLLFFHYHPIQLFLRRIVKLWWQKKDKNKKTGPKENSRDNFFAGKLFISSRCTEDDGKKFPNI